MKSKQRRKWEKIRQDGKAYFIIFRGILGWGTPMAVFLALNFYFILGDKSHLLPKAVITLIVSWIGGYFWGLNVWTRMENKYLLNDSDNE